MKFRIYEVEGLYYPCSENKGAEQGRGQLRNNPGCAATKARKILDLERLRGLSIKYVDFLCNSGLLYDNLMKSGIDRVLTMFYFRVCNIRQCFNKIIFIMYVSMTTSSAMRRTRRWLSMYVDKTPK